MTSRRAALFTAIGFAALFAFLRTSTPTPEETVLRAQTKNGLPARVLPGILPDGSVQLPNQWRIRPAGKQVEVGDLPINSALHPSGQYLAVLHGGMREHEVVIIDLNKTKQKIVSRATIDQTVFGLTFSGDGRKLYASGGEFEVVHEFEFARGLLGNPRQIHLQGAAEKLLDKLVVGGLTMDATGRDLFVCCTWGDIVVRIPAENPENRTVISLAREKVESAVRPRGAPPSPPDNRKDPNEPKRKNAAKPKELPVHPYAALAHPDGKILFVTLWGDSAVAVIDLEKNEVIKRLPTAAHPTELIFDKVRNALYVACANSTIVNAFDGTTFESLQTINCALHPAAGLAGNTPNSLTLLPDGLLAVANADANNLAILNVQDPKKAIPLGFIPTGWYPTSVRYNATDKKIYVSNGKGMSSKPNRYGPNPINPARGVDEYIGGLFKGTVSVIDLPTPATLATLTRTAFACSPMNKDALPDSEGVPADNPIPKKLGDASPIKHVIYIIKENRTYDQVFGDLPQGNGEPELCLFPAAITPNHHKLATEYVLLDNFYVDGEVSADGHEWTMGAYATDYVEKCWPLSYRGSPRKTFGYPSEGANDQMARPAGGYLWDRAAEAKVTYRSYGEWVNNGKSNPDGTFEDGVAAVPALVGHIDPKYRSYDLEFTDVSRAERFIEELSGFEKAGTFPQLTIVKLPNDHTAGTRVGKPTPTAMVADNDLALGMIVEAVSKTKFWKDTAIFVIEDDTQNGPDHVDAHRSVALVVSPWTKRKHVDSTMYSTTSMLRTMELILGLKPMSQFDAAAKPMYNSFHGKPDASVYSKEIPKTDLKATNLAGAWGAEWSEKANLAKEDLADDLKFSEVIWKAVKGAKSPMPAPVRAAFYRPIIKKDDDND
jgi:YVTN family beta-propeller protein